MFKMLAALALLLLAVSSLNEGRIVNKCELKTQLDAAQFQVTKAMGNRMTVEDLVARLVCKASTSAFDTSFVKNMTVLPPQASAQKHPRVWRHYGLFQLGDLVACHSGVVSSLNVCQMNCTALTDDDVTDDIHCLKTVMNSVKPSPKPKPSHNILPLSTLHGLLVKECRDIIPARYFAECVK